MQNLGVIIFEHAIQVHVLDLRVDLPLDRLALRSGVGGTLRRELLECGDAVLLQVLLHFVFVKVVHLKRSSRQTFRQSLAQRTWTSRKAI